MNVILLSMPAAGKGAQADMLSEEYGLTHVSPGELFRNEIHNQTKLGNEIKDIMDNGFLVGEEIVEKLLFNKLDEVKSHYILDGFPRNIEQSLVYDEYIKKNNQKYLTIFLNVDYEEAKRRVTGRLVCSNCDDSFNIYSNKPITENICDACGSTLVKREDDSDEHFANRYNVFLNETMPVIEFYKKHNKILIIDANKDSKSMFADIKRNVDDYFDKD